MTNPAWSTPLEFDRVIVTGGGSGIGRATVLRLLREAGTVHTVDVDEPGLVSTAELADAEGIGKHLTTGVLDIADEQAVDTGVRATVDRLGGLDVLVNAAGILRAANTHECTLDMWNQVININLTGTFLMCRAAIPALLESEHAAIVNFSSTSATFGHPYMAAYAASKGGIDAMTHTLAMEYAKRGIRVTAVAPGSIQSGITETTGGMIPGDADWSLFAKMSPIVAEGFAPPDVVASVIAMLASDDGRFVTGPPTQVASLDRDLRAEVTHLRERGVPCRTRPRGGWHWSRARARGGPAPSPRSGWPPRGRRSRSPRGRSTASSARAPRSRPSAAPRWCCPATSPRATAGATRWWPAPKPPSGPSTSW
jgi:NAD(P)-dependent dehydrogenase (short-subunit alcohol dehydrogenase family)